MRADKRLVFVLNFISICTLILGIIGLICLPSFDSSTIIEEHAFSEGNSNSLFSSKWLLEAKKITHCLLIAQNDIKNNSNKISEILIEVLRREIPHSFSDIADLKVMKRQFSVNSLFDEEFTVNRFSEYISAFVPARRGDGFESILFVVNFPWSIENNFGLADAAGIAIALAKYMTTVQWLSKNIHFLFTDSRLSYSAGIRAFLKDYSSELPNLIYTGIIRTALVLQILNSNPSRILLDIESQDGIIPNQDLVNAVVKEFQSKLPRPLVSIDPRIIWNSIIRQATNGGSEKAHTPLLQYSIPAYTIILTDDETLKEYEFKSIDKPISFGILEDSENPSTNFITSPIIQLSDLVKTLEGIIRIQSNLHEELHHSFNFYLFTSYISHISSGVYIYPIILLCTSIVFQIISLLQRSSSPLYFLISLGCLGYFILTIFPIYWLINNALKLTLLHKLFDLLYNGPFPKFLFFRYSTPTCTQDIKLYDEIQGFILLWTVITLITGCFFIILFVFIMNNILPKIFGNSTKSTNWKYNIKCMTKILIRLYTIIFIILISIYNFSLSFILTPLIILLINIKISTLWSFIISFFKFTIFEQFTNSNQAQNSKVNTLEFFNSNYIYWVCIILTIFTLATLFMIFYFLNIWLIYIQEFIFTLLQLLHIFFIYISNIIIQILGISSNSIPRTDLDNFDSLWHSVLGHIFIASTKNRLLSKLLGRSKTLEHIYRLQMSYNNTIEYTQEAYFKVYRMLKVFPPLQLSSWLIYQSSTYELPNVSSYKYIFGKSALKIWNNLILILYRLIRDAKCSQSKMFHLLWFGTLPQIFLAIGVSLI